MPFPLSNNNAPIFQDMGQGAAGRIASWQAWTADPNPMSPDPNNPGQAQTIIMRDDTYEPMLDGSSQGLGGGAISGGDNAFLQDV